MRIVIPVIFLILLSACLQDEPFKKEPFHYEPIAMDDEWITSTPEQENIIREDLLEAYRLLFSDRRFVMARSMLVIRNGKLVAEAYPHKLSDRDEYANIQSCTKSFTSLMVGIAIEEGADISLDDRLYDIYPGLFDNDLLKRQITLRDALGMKAGLDFENEKHSLKLYQQNGNSTRYVLSFPLVNTPGSLMHYNDGAPHLVSKAIEVKTGMSLSAFAEEKLFAPLGIQHWKWEQANDGTTYGAFGLYLKPRDFARVGQLLLQQGEWGEKKIINSDYLVQATTAHASQWNIPYGYYFWINDEMNGYYMHGHGGQVLMIVPEKNLVMLYTAWPYTSGEFFDDALEMFSIIARGCR